MVIKEVWCAAVGEELSCMREVENYHDPFARGSHRNVLCTSSCDGDQSEIKGSSTQASNDQGIKMAFRPQI